MDIQNAINKLQSAINPSSMLNNMLNPVQKQMVNVFKNKTPEEQAEAIAQKCNELGLSRDDFNKIVSLVGKR